MRKLSAKQQAWIDYYKQGYGVGEAAKMAGYRAKDDNCFSSIGSENLRKLAQYVQDRDEILASPRIADMEEINEFWTAVMHDENESTKNRLKASEYRARAMGAFVDNVRVAGQVNTSITKLDGILAQLKE